MKSLILKQGLNHAELTVYQSSNNFGDQILTFIYEGLDGSKIRNLELYNPEGCWTEFTKKNMLSLYNVNQWTFENPIKE